MDILSAMSRRLPVRAALAAGMLLVVLARHQAQAAVAPHPAAIADDSAAVAAVVERFHAALEAGDSTSVLALLAPDAVVVESGSIETREEYRAHHLPADIAFANAVTSVRTPPRVKVRGDVSWSTSTSTVRGEFRGRAVNSSGAELMVLTREGDGWKISAIHWSSRSRRV
jgi:ketosteroid isomerase-like protein